MILKASQRGGASDLAAHLMKAENEHVRVHELRGFASNNLKGAFQESEAISLGTKCRQHLFSLSLNPPESESVPVEIFVQAIDRIEALLGLDGQPRAIVFHEKEGRRHAHGVWSRIDADTMTACQMSFFKKKLMGVSRDLYLENGWKMPRGLENAAERNPTNFTLAEWQQAKRQGIDPRWLKGAVQDCWKRSDSRRTFENALKERGFFLATGDKRGLVILDHTGEVYSLPRTLDIKTKDVRARLGDGQDLPSVAATKAVIGQKMTPALRRHVEESRTKFAKRSAVLGQSKAEMTKAHREARVEQDASQKVEWENETRQRAARVPKGLLGLWHRITGKYKEVRSQNEAEAQATRERQDQARQKLIEAQLQQRAALQSKFKELRHGQAEELLTLRGDIGRYFKFSRGVEVGAARDRGSSLELSLER